MSPEEFEAAINGFTGALLDELPRMTARAATTAKGLVQLRIQDRGKNYKDQDFTPYTEPYLKRKERIKGSVTHVDLTLSGNMWESIGIIDSGQQGSTFFTTVGARDQETSKKMEGNANKRGDFLEVSQKEQEVIVEDFDNDFQDLLDKFFPDNA